MAEEQKVDWFKIIMVCLTGLLAFFSVYMTIRANEEEQKKVTAFNRLAAMDTVRREANNNWTRLSQQKDNLIDELRKQNASLADDIDERNQNILALSETVARVRSARIVIRSQDGDDVHETPQPDGRVRVDFAETQDPMRVEGFTLTNPAEADLTVSFVRPLRLRTTIVQNQDGSWRTYFESDWPNLEIEEMNTSVSPLVAAQRAWYKDIAFGVSLGTNFSLDSGYLTGRVLYDFGDFGIGLEAGGAFVEDDLSIMVGLAFQVKPL